MSTAEIKTPEGVNGTNGTATAAQPQPVAASPTPFEATNLDGLTVKEVVTQTIRLLQFLRRSILFLLGGALLGAGLGAGSAFLHKPQPTAYFEVRLSPTTAENPIAKYERRNVEYFRSAHQAFVAMPLIRETLTDVGDAEPDDSRMTGVRQALSFHEVGYYTFSGRYTSASEEEAVTLLEEHMRNYLDSEIEKTIGTIQSEADFLRSEVDKIESELQASEQALRQFKEQHADGLPEQAENHYKLLRGLQQRRIDVNARLEQLSLELRLNREKLDGEKLFVESKVISTQRAQPYQMAMVDAQSRLAEAKAGNLGPTHPEVVRLEKLVTALKQLGEAAREMDEGDTEVERTRNPIFESIQDAIYQLEIQEMVAKNELDQIERNLSRAQEIVDQLPELEAMYADLTRSYDSNRSLHDRLFEQMKVVEVQLALERASQEARYQVLTPPRLVYNSQNKLMAVRGIMLGMAFSMLGLGIAAGRELKAYVLG